MKQFHTISGLPRSGSTLLCNILNQNPLFYASSTSPLCGFVSQLSSAISHSIEFKAELNDNSDKANLRAECAVRSIVDSWYSDFNDKVVFDKGRAWCSSSLVLRQLFPDAKIIVMVRDLRNIFASIEKQHKKNPVLDEANDFSGKQIFNRADAMFSPSGLIGGPIAGIEDIINRKNNSIIFVQYETLASNPQAALDKIYRELGLDIFQHNFDDIKNTATDPDGFYLDKYPHEGSGKVVPSNPSEWKEHFSDDIANLIMGRFQFFNKYFGYL